jgi:hypothetical protein
VTDTLEPEGVVSILALAVVFAIVFEPPALQKRKKSFNTYIL